MSETLKNLETLVLACPVRQLRCLVKLDRPLLMQEQAHASLTTSLTGAFKTGLKKTCCERQQRGGCACSVSVNSQLQCSHPESCFAPWLYNPQHGTSLLPSVLLYAPAPPPDSEKLWVTLTLRGEIAHHQQNRVLMALEASGNPGIKYNSVNVGFRLMEVHSGEALNAQVWAQVLRAFPRNSLRIEFLTPFQPSHASASESVNIGTLTRWIVDASYNSARFSLADREVPGDHHPLALAMKETVAQTLQDSVRLLASQVHECQQGERRSKSNGGTYTLLGWEGHLDLSVRDIVLPWIANFALFGGSRHAQGRSRMRLWATID